MPDNKVAPASRLNRCTSPKAVEFEDAIHKCNTNLNVFIKLFNMWSQMSTNERGECIDKLLWR